MGRNIRISEPSAEMQSKIIKARRAIAEQQPRSLKCPYCKRNSIIVFGDTRGHVQAKCKYCGKETVFNVVDMRRLRRVKAYCQVMNRGYKSNSSRASRDLVRDSGQR